MFKKRQKMMEMILRQRSDGKMKKIEASTIWSISTLVAFIHACQDTGVATNLSAA